MQTLQVARAVKPVAHPHPSPKPVINFRNRTIIFRYSEIVHPAPELLRKLHHAVFHGHEPASAGQAFDSPFKLVKRIVRPPDFGTFEGEPQKVRVIRFRHAAFLLVDLEFEPTWDLGTTVNNSITFTQEMLY
jgi:hypothetical protein